jgi:hypothetical protein
MSDMLLLSAAICEVVPIICVTVFLLAVCCLAAIMLIVGKDKI